MCEKNQDTAKTFEINNSEKSIYNLESSKSKPYDIDLMTKSSNSQSTENNKRR